MEKNFYRDEIRKIFIIYGISFILLSVISVYAFLVFYSNNNIKEKNIESNHKTGSFIKEEFQNYSDKILSFEKSEAINRFIMFGNNMSEVYEILYDFINNSQIRSIFYIVSRDGKTLLTNNYTKSPYNGSDLFFKGLFKQLKARPDEIVMMNNKIQIDGNKRTIYSIGKAMISYGRVTGYLVFDILESDLNKQIDNSNVDIIVVTDKYNNIIISTNSLVGDDIGKFTPRKAINNKVEFLDKSYYYYKTSIFNDEIIIYTLTELEFIENLTKVSIIYLIFIFMALSFITVIVSKYVSAKKTKSVELLIEAINKAQKGDLNAFVSIHSNDAFEQIGNHFNKMLVDLNMQIKKNHELINRNRLSEIMQLEAQINPHFIFNTLETLKYMIRIDQKKSVDIVISLANILRYSINYEEKKISLEEDLNYLNNYFIIQKYRFNQRLEYIINIQDEAKKCKVPKLILQPLVENCINHAYITKENLWVKIDIYMKDVLYLEIEDNGEGIEEERLKEIIGQLENNNIAKQRIGLNNVYRRIKLLYGDDYGMNIESKKGVGTKIIIKLPIETE